MATTLIFGTIGNTGALLGAGWSAEGQYAWAVDDISTLDLPIPQDGQTWRFQADVHGFTYPPELPEQTLIVRAGERELARFRLAGRTRIVVDIPPDAPRSGGIVRLTLDHPDAARPSDLLGVDDARRLAVCFHSAVLDAVVAPIKGVRRRGRAAETVRGICAGDEMANEIVRIFTALPALADRVRISFVDASVPADPARREALRAAVQDARFCWIQSSVGTAAARQALERSLPADCRALVFPSPQMNALWPLQGYDPRAVPEPRYSPARYPTTDHAAAGVAAANLSDDVALLAYDRAAQDAMPDLDDALAADFDSWDALDARADIRIGDFLRENFRGQRLFLGPRVPAPALTRELALRLFAATRPLRAAVPAEALAPALDALLDGYVGRRMDVPVDPAVARHFGLAWWSPDMVHAWFGNRRTRSEYLRDYLGWAPWRP